MASSQARKDPVYQEALQTGRPPNKVVESLAVPKIIWSALSRVMLIFVIGILFVLLIKGGEVNFWFIEIKIPFW